MSQTIQPFAIQDTAPKSFSVPARPERPDQIKAATGLVLGLGISLAAWSLVAIGAAVHWFT